MAKCLNGTCVNCGLFVSSWTLPVLGEIDSARIERPHCPHCGEEFTEIIIERTPIMKGHTKPPLGAKPTYISSRNRIWELASAICRASKAEDSPRYTENVQMWAKEMILQAQVIDKMAGAEHDWYQKAVETATKMNPYKVPGERDSYSD